MLRKLLLLSLATASFIGYAVVGSTSALADGTTGFIRICNAVGDFKTVGGSTQVIEGPVLGCVGIGTGGKIWWDNNAGGAWRLVPGNGLAHELVGSFNGAGVPTPYVCVTGPTGIRWLQFWVGGTAGHWAGSWVRANSTNCLV